MISRTLRAVASESHPGHIHPVGSEVEMIGYVDPAKQYIFAGFRVPDDQLVGGAWYETLEVSADDVAVDPINLLHDWYVSHKGTTFGGIRYNEYKCQRCGMMSLYVRRPNPPHMMECWEYLIHRVMDA